MLLMQGALFAGGENRYSVVGVGIGFGAVLFALAIAALWLAGPTSVVARVSRLRRHQESQLAVG